MLHTCLRLLLVACFGVAADGVLLGKPPGPQAAETGSLRKRGRTDLFGDPLPPAAAARLGTMRFRPGGTRVLAFTNQGMELASWEQAGLVRIWDAFTGTERRQFAAHLDEARAPVFSANGRLFALGAVDGSVRVWDLTTEREVYRPSGKDAQVMGLAFSGDNATLACVRFDGSLQLWDLQAGRERGRWPADPKCAWSVALSADGSMVATGGEDKTTVIWDAATGRRLRQLGKQPEVPLALAFSPEGRLLVTGCAFGNDQDLHIWDIATGREMHRLSGHSSPVTAAAFSPDGKTIAASAADVTLWDVATGRALRQITRLPMPSIAFRRDGKVLAGIGWEKVIHLWDPTSGRELPQTAIGQGSIIAVGFVGESVATASSDGDVHLWDARTARELRRWPASPHEIRGMVCAPGGGLLATAQPLVLWDPRTGRELCRCQTARFVACLAFSPDAKLLATAGDGPLCLWDCATGRQVARLTTRFDSPPFSLFSPDGRFLAAGDIEITLWDIKSRRKLRTLGPDIQRSSTNHLVTCPGPRNRSFTFSPDGRLLAISNYRTRRIHLLEVATGLEVRRFDPQDQFTFDLAFSPDGRLIAVAGEKGAFVWPVTSGPCVDLAGHRGRVTSLAFARTSKVLVTGGEDTTALVWDITALNLKPNPTQVELAPKELAALWTDLASENAGVAWHAIEVLAAHPGDAVTLLSQYLQAVPSADLRRIHSLIGELDDDRFSVREQATAELRKLGLVAEPALSQALADGPSSEALIRITKLLKGGKTPGLAAEATRKCRSLAILEKVATSSAARLLEKVASGSPEAPLTQEAKAALQRLGQPPLHNQ